MSVVAEITARDVMAASGRLAGQAVQTPLLRYPFLDERTGGTILVKAENLQIIGAFKFRGAFNRLVQLSAAECKRGVVAMSSGNHAQGVAAAARRLGIAAAIVMPQDAPAIKIESTRRLGGEVIFYDRYTQSRERIAQELTEARGAILVPPYDDPHIIAGQGTVGAEIVQQAAALGFDALDAAVIPCGGGGLIAGCSIALTAAQPRIQIYSAEPVGYDDTARSLKSGKRETAPGGATLCDALMAPTPGELTFSINQRLLAGGFAVSDQQVIEAIVYAWREMKLVVEPGGAVALAAILSGMLDCRGKTVAVVLSGGNADPQAYASWIARPPQ